MVTTPLSWTLEHWYGKFSCSQFDEMILNSRLCFCGVFCHLRQCAGVCFVLDIKYAESNQPTRICCQRKTCQKYPLNFNYYSIVDIVFILHICNYEARVTSIWIFIVSLVDHFVSLTRITRTSWLESTQICKSSC